MLVVVVQKQRRLILEQELGTARSGCFNVMTEQSLQPLNNGNLAE